MAAPTLVAAATMDALVWTAPKTMEMQNVAVPAPAQMACATHGISVLGVWAALFSAAFLGAAAALLNITF